LADEARELSERREHLDEEWRAFAEARSRLAGDRRQPGPVLGRGPAAPAPGRDEAEAQAGEEAAQHLGWVEVEQQRGMLELEGRAAALERLRSELAAGARDEALAAADLARLRAELSRMEDEQSRVKTSMFQYSCELAEFRAPSEAAAEQASGPEIPRSSTASVAHLLPTAVVSRSPVNQDHRNSSISTSRGGRTTGQTPVSRRSSGHSTPRRLHLEEEGARSAAGSPGNAQMALTRARRDLAAAQQRHGRDSLEALRAAGDLALQLEEAGEAPEEVGRLLKSVLVGFERLLGEDHLDTLRTANNVAVFLDNSGEAEEALPLYRRAAEGRRRQLGKDHPHALDSTYNLALFLQNSGELAEAEQLFREVLCGCAKTFGVRHHSSLDCVERLVEVLEQSSEGDGDHEGDAGRLEERTRLCRELLDGREASLGAEHSDTLRASVLLLEAVSTEQGVASEAVEQVHRDVIRRHEEVLGLADPATLELTMDLAAGLAGRGEVARAEEVLSEAHSAAERAFGPASPAALGYDDELAVVLANAGRLGEAEPLFRRALSERRKALGPWHEDTLRSEHNLAVLLDNAGQREEAGRAYREVHRGRCEVLGEAHPKTVEATYNLAVFLAGHGEGSEVEAKQLLLVAQRGLEAQFGQDDMRTAACAKRLEELCRGHKAISETAM